ncbi:hypothetical protein [Cohnella rhizosphaerae]|uniref:Uncharacterized protein n=1 Tax=Cohnella rhizosphaerae TaxID=1457232 RepID=A0A9X4KST0_9BACL|nr:hypothetical protein [Cohnella rhizosphaerae]MDG0810242.1 hypothetical protein [Cohnella rhizosphaerae]
MLSISSRGISSKKSAEHENDDELSGRDVGQYRRPRTVDQVQLRDEHELRNQREDARDHKKGKQNGEQRRLERKFESGEHVSAQAGGEQHAKHREARDDDRIF